MLVHFYDTDEFVAEIERSQAAVANQSVRVTTLRTYATPARVSVIATAKVFSAIPGHEDYDLVRCQRIIGDLWGHTQDDDVIARANDGVADLKIRLEELGFTVAAGLYAEAAR